MYDPINACVLVVMLLAASYFDIKEKRIPNFITFTGVILGMIIAIISGGFEGLQFSLIGFLFGIAAFFIPFAFNMMGAGDVKLMGAIGALMGWKFSLSVIVYAAIAGGIIAVVIAIWNKRLVTIIMASLGMLLNPLLVYFYKISLNTRIMKIKTFFDSYKLDNKKKYIPYGVAIAIGSFLVLNGVVKRII